MGFFARRQFKGIEVAHFDGGVRSFAPHFHDEFVLSVNVQGLEKIKLDRRNFDASTGEVVIYNPAQVQSSNVVSAPWRFVSMYVDPTVLPATFGISAETVFDTYLLSIPQVATKMHRAILSALNGEAPDCVVQEGLIEVVADLLKLAGSSQIADGRHIPASIRQIAERLRDSKALPSLEDLSTEASLTPVQIVRAFTKAYGVPPLTWAWNRRVTEARAMLARGESIAAVAADLGFSDQAHLTRRFRAFFGVPPSQWRKG
jgi:AraC family transcriptional regulator, chemosensory pili system protein ChpD